MLTSVAGNRVQYTPAMLRNSVAGNISPEDRYTGINNLVHAPVDIVKRAIIYYPRAPLQSPQEQLRPSSLFTRVIWIKDYISRWKVRTLRVPTGA